MVLTALTPAVALVKPGCRSDIIANIRIDDAPRRVTAASAPISMPKAIAKYNGVITYAESMRRIVLNIISVSIGEMLPIREDYDWFVSW